MAELELTPKQRQALKGRAHALDPVVLLGAQGLSEAVLREIDRALAAHELIKVRVPGDDRDARAALAHQVADALGAARVQAIGKLLVLYRPLPADERARRDAKAAAAARAQLPPAARRAAPPSKKAAGSAGARRTAAAPRRADRPAAPARQAAGSRGPARKR